ncbi:MAG: DUF2306 domain-containing protein [Saccharospirillaceae bacterium]|nr:DUF2306 domain-containing protein [Saccharospirillaceae bacterium]MCD8531326.1 DUF2306 domain-containing protein [Saccharospirillaceae bacterium]
MKKTPKSTQATDRTDLTEKPHTTGAAAMTQWLWPLIGALLLAYGALAFNSGLTLSPLSNHSDNPAETATTVLQQASSGVDMRGSPEVQNVVPAWVNLMAHISSSEYAYGADGISDTNIYYFSMPEARRHVLSTHMMLGLVLMVAGFLQFWPGFRRRYRKAHRLIGVAYILAAFVSMGMSGHHLINSGIANTYNTFVFHIGLWIMLVGVLVSLTMAGIALLRKDIARHLGWQALGFGFLLTAPLQRMDWLLLSGIADGVSFNEMNILVNTILFAQATLAGFGLFWLNRASSPLRNNAALTLRPLNRPLQWVGYGVILLSALVLMLPMIMGVSVADIGWMQRMVPAMPLAWLAALLDTAWLPLFGLLLTVLLASAWVQWVAARAGVETSATLPRITLISLLAVVSMLFYAAYQLGMPTHARSSAGAGFAVMGALLLVFGLLLQRAIAHAERGKVVESLQMVLLCATAPLLLVMNGLLFDLIGAVPAEYLARSAAYEMAVIGALFVPLLAGGLLSVYSAETGRYRIS